MLPRELMLSDGRSLRLGGRALVMGILNCTPDSFFDGGKYESVDAAVEAGLRMQQEGADIIDVGPQSTRPGSHPVSVREQCTRVVPVIAGLRAVSKIAISIDTTSTQVARAALDAGADMVNDISALRGCPAMADLVAERKVPVVLMHMQGTPATMQLKPQYSNVVTEVRDFLLERVAYAESAGIARDRILLDPGFGFGKTLEHNLALMAGLAAFASLDLPLMVGMSRKSMIGQALGLDLDARLEPSIALAVLAVERGASVVRVHDVAATVRAVRMAEVVCTAGGG